MPSYLLDVVVRLSSTFEKMSAGLHDATTLLNPSNPLGDTLAPLDRHYDSLRARNDAVCSDLFSHARLWQQHHAELAACPKGVRLVAAHRVYVGHLRSFTQAATKRFRSVDTEAMMRQRSTPQLWMLLWDVTGSLWERHLLWSPHGTPLLTSDRSALVPVIADLHEWLLRFVRRHTPAKTLLDIPGVVLQVGVFKLLQPLVVHLLHLTTLPERQLCTEWRALPAACVTTLCTLAVELFPFSAPRNEAEHVFEVERQTRVCDIAHILGRAITAHALTATLPGTPLPQDLTTAVALEVAKLAASSFAKDGLAGRHPAYESLLKALDTLLELRNADPVTWPPILLPPSAPQSIRRLAGGGSSRGVSSTSSNSEALAMAATDRQLLSDMRRTAASHPRHLARCSATLLGAAPSCWSSSA